MGLISRVSSRTYRQTRVLRPFSIMAYRGGYRGGYRGYRGQQIFRPEIALARAEEFVKVENKEAALETLKEFLKSRKQRQFTVHHPKIMVLYINLCIELRKSQVAKEGLYQFKALTQHQCPDELQKIIEYYLEQAADRAKKAKKQCKESAGELADIDDLASCVSPESLMLQAVTQASDSDRAERLHLTPWVKFLWDAYRQCLDVVKNNKVLESLYREVAEKACRFCNKFTRTNEFRKLCDTQRENERKVAEDYETKLKFVRAKLEEMKMDDKLVTHVEFLDAEDLVKLGQDEADKEFQETIVEKQIGGVREKLINQKRSLGKREEEKDFFERAKRQEETRLRVDSLPKRQARLKHDVKKSYDLAVERSKAQHEESLGYKHKFAHMGVKIAEFTEDIAKSAGQQFDKELKAFDDMKSQYIQEKRKQLREEFLTEEREAHEASLEEARGVIKAWEIEEEKRMAELEAQAEKE